MINLIVITASGDSTGNPDLTNWKIYQKERSIWQVHLNKVIIFQISISNSRFWYLNDFEGVDQCKWRVNPNAFLRFGSQSGK
jgi:hypothetical protein